MVFNFVVNHINLFNVVQEIENYEKNGLVDYSKQNGVQIWDKKIEDLNTKISIIEAKKILNLNFVVAVVETNKMENEINPILVSVVDSNRAIAVVSKRHNLLVKLRVFLIV